MSLDDFSDAYLTIQLPTKPDVVALEKWDCHHCNYVQWARVSFQELDEDHFQFVGAEGVKMDIEQVGSVNYLSRMVDTWIETNPDPAARRVHDLIGHLIPWLARKNA